LRTENLFNTLLFCPETGFIEAKLKNYIEKDMGTAFLQIEILLAIS
jgi:hypothetical protein